MECVHIEKWRETIDHAYAEAGNIPNRGHKGTVVVRREVHFWQSILEKVRINCAAVIVLACLCCLNSAAAQSPTRQESIAGNGAISPNQGSTFCSDQWLSRLQEEIENGQFKDSLHTLEAESTPCSGNAQYHVVLSRALQKNGDPAKAALELDKAIKLDPHRPESFFRLAHILFENGDLGGARLLLVRANQKFPNETWTYLFLSTVLDKLGSARDAEQLLETASKRWPRLPEVHILLGNMLSAMDQQLRAIGEYETALRINPALPQAYLFYGIELDKLDRTEEALTALKKCVQLAPLMSNSHYYLGTLLLKKGELTEAVQELETAIKIDPQYALVYFQLGKAYQKLGDRPRAQEYIQRYGLLYGKQKSEDTERSARFREELSIH